MPRICLLLAGLLAVLTVAQSHAQTAPEPGIHWLPPANQPPSAPAVVPLTAPANVSPASGPPTNLPAAGSPPMDVPPSGFLTSAPPVANPPPSDEKIVSGESIKLDGSAKTPPVVSLSDFLGYRYAENSLDWIPGNGNQFGMFSIIFNHFQKAGFTHGLGIGMGFHFLSGPVQTDMPPIVYDFSAAYQIRMILGLLEIDAAASVLEATDFKGNAGQGLQYPAHAVGYLGVGPAIDLVFGVDYVDLGSIKILPVAGLIWKPNPAMRFEAVFPRPRAVFQLSDNYRFYVSGQLGGGSWSIERADTFDDDLATYRDLRVCIGIEHAEGSNQWCALEAGYLFNRRLEYSSGLGNMPLLDAAIIRLVTRY